MQTMLVSHLALNTTHVSNVHQSQAMG